MTESTRQRLGALLGGLSIVCIAVCNVLLFRAGCAGDTKSGSYGDPLRVVALEDKALPFLLAASLLAGAVYVVISKAPPVRRWLIALALSIASLVVIWLVGIFYMEELGIKSCFRL